MIPAAFLRVHPRFELGGGSAAGRARSTTSGHVEPLFLEHVERLLDRRVFQKEPAQQYHTAQLVSMVNVRTDHNNIIYYRCKSSFVRTAKSRRKHFPKYILFGRFIDQKQNVHITYTP